MPYRTPHGIEDEDITRAMRDRHRLQLPTRCRVFCGTCDDSSPSACPDCPKEHAMYNATKITVLPEPPPQFVKLTVFSDLASIDAIEDTLRAMPAVLDFSSDGQGQRVAFDVRCEDGAAMVPKLRKALPATGVSVLPWVALYQADGPPPLADNGMPVELMPRNRH